MDRPCRDGAQVRVETEITEVDSCRSECTEDSFLHEDTLSRTKSFCRLRRQTPLRVPLG